MPKKIAVVLSVALVLSFALNLCLAWKILDIALAATDAGETLKMTRNFGLDAIEVSNELAKDLPPEKVRAIAESLKQRDNCCKVSDTAIETSTLDFDFAGKHALISEPNIENDGAARHHSKN